MKVLFANKYFYTKGGSEYNFFELARLLKDNGHKVIFFSMKHPKNIYSEYNEYFVSNVDYESCRIRDMMKVASRLLYSLEARQKIERLIKDEKPDIAHLHNIHHQISPSILHSFRKYRIPVVLTLHDYKMVCASYSMMANGEKCDACENGSYYHCLIKGCVKGSRLKSLLSTVEMYLHHEVLHIYDLVDAFIAPSIFLKSKLEEMGFKGKIVHLPYLLRAEHYKAQYEWQEDSVVYFGRLTKEKGLFNLIEAFKNIKDLTLKILGDGPLKSDLLKKIEEEGIKNIVLLGYKEGQELRDEITKSMFVILPSEWYENYPFSVIEGFAMGKPAVASRIGGIPELVKDGITGFTFEPGNPDDLCEKIEHLRSSADKIIYMGKSARAFVEEELNARKHYGRLTEIYKGAIESKLKC